MNVFDLFNYIFYITFVNLNYCYIIKISLIFISFYSSYVILVP